MSISAKWPLPVSIGAGALVVVTIISMAYAAAILANEECLTARDDPSRAAQAADAELGTTTFFGPGSRGGGLSTEAVVHNNNLESYDNETSGDCLPQDCGAFPAEHGSQRFRHRDILRARVIGVIASEVQRRAALGRFTGTRDDSEPEEPEYSSIRQYLIKADEQPSDVPEVIDILSDPSNIVSEGDSVNLVAWDVREVEPRGSYLYVLQQDIENNISQLHRYFCLQRRLDILAETCEPIASVFSDAGEPVAVQYTEDGVPTQREAADLDPAQFSRARSYVEANEFLLYLQDYFDDTRA